MLLKFLVRHQVQFNNHHSRDVARSTTTETPGNLDTKVGKLYQRDSIFFLKQARVGAERTSSGKSCGRIKSKTVTKVFFSFVYRWVELRNLLIGWLYLVPYLPQQIDR